MHDDNDKRMNDDREEARLEALFAEARDAAPVVGDDLMQRILADAVAVQPMAGPVATSVEPRPIGRFWQLLDLLGGPRAATALASMVLVGVWLGYAQPVPVTALGDLAQLGGTGFDMVELMPDFDDFLAEG